MGNPPIGHERACYTKKLVPQAHVEGVSAAWLPAISESNGICEGTIVEGETNSSSGRVVSQLEA